ncbi:TPA: hypothetical protein ACH3X2_006935 [Trebouxia sp. C0005]
MAYNSNKAKTVRKPLFMTHRKSTKEEDSMGGEHGDEKKASEESQAEDDPAEDHLAEAEPVAHETQSHEEPEDTKSDGEFEDGSEAGEGSEAEAEDGSEAEEPEARAGPAENAETVLGKRASKPTYKVAHQERQEDVNDAALGQEQPASKACKQPKKPKQPKQPSKEAKLPRKGSKKESKQPVVQRNSIPAKVASTAAAKVVEAQAKAKKALAAADNKLEAICCKRRRVPRAKLAKPRLHQPRMQRGRRDTLLLMVTSVREIRGPLAMMLRWHLPGWAGQTRTEGCKGSQGPRSRQEGCKDGRRSCQGGSRGWHPARDTRKTNDAYAGLRSQSCAPCTRTCGAASS